MPICATPVDIPEAVYLRTATWMCQPATRHSLVHSLADVFPFWVWWTSFKHCAAAVATVSTVWNSLQYVCEQSNVLTATQKHSYRQITPLNYPLITTRKCWTSYTCLRQMSDVFLLEMQVSWKLANSLLLFLRSYFTLTQTLELIDLTWGNFLILIRI